MASEQIVTQEELNSLLSSLGTELEGDASAGRNRRRRAVVHEARVHDFQRSDALGRSVVQQLESVHELFARNAANTLAMYLHRRCQISPLSLDQLTFEQFQRSVPDPTVIAVFDLSPLPGKALLEINQVIGLSIVDSMIGRTEGAPSVTRPLSEVEKALVKGALEKLLTDLRNAWKPIAAIKAGLLQIVHSPEAARITEPADPVIVGFFEVRLGDLVGMASICLPSHALRTAAGGGAPSLPDEAREERLISHVSGMQAACTVQLTTLRLPVADLAALGEGDVLRLDVGPSDPVTLLVEGLPKFSCRTALSGLHLVAEVVGPIEEQ